MAILVFNSGSSSLKFRLYVREAGGELRPRADGAITRLGPQANWRWRASSRETSGNAPLADHAAAARWVLARLLEQEAKRPIEAVGHRVVHGGDAFREPVLLTDQTIARLETLSSLAPLHNPPALQVIQACRAALGPACPMVAVFDTAFHTTLPEHARCYALPPEWVRAHAIRRYGFHGIAHRYLFERCIALSKPGSAAARVITFQLGNGCSACAVENGKSVETSMGHTPLEGLIMSTRVGDVDPGALVQVVAAGVPAHVLEDRLNRAAGLLALSGETGDMQALLALAAGGHARARLAVEAFCHRARKYLGAYLAVLGGADAVVFGGGIGENAPAIRERICAGMDWAGLQLDPQANAAAIGIDKRISKPGAATAVYVIAVDEEIVIARDTDAVLAGAAAKTE